MHEMSIAQSILDIVLQESQTHQVSQVLSISLKLGELSAVEPESLRFCFGLLTQGTLAEGARLDIERQPITCRCRDCGSNFTVRELTFNCPTCKGSGLEMLTGRELSIESFEGE